MIVFAVGREVGVRWGVVVRVRVATRAVTRLVIVGVLVVAVVGGVGSRAASLSGVTAAGAVRGEVLREGALGVGPGRAWPVGDASGLLRRFDPPPVRWAAGHRGVDLAASPGTAVRAAAPGVVTFSGQVAGCPVVVVSHPGSGSPPLRTTYLPVAGSVSVGTAVSAGEPIGALTADSGHCPVDCLHWGLLRGTRYLDPLALLGTGRARLLPLDSPAP